MGAESERVKSFGNLEDGLFNEYFHSDNGGLGASHQTGWTGIVADAILRFHGAVESIGDVLRDVQNRVASR
jgi:hypothetical protein